MARIDTPEQGSLNSGSENPGSEDPKKSISHLPAGERYLYQLFSLIEIGDLTVTNPRGEVFHFGTVGTSSPLHLIVHNPDTYDRILAFGTLGFCEAYMEGWWDEANHNLVELILSQQCLCKSAEQNYPSAHSQSDYPTSAHLADSG